MNRLWTASATYLVVTSLLLLLPPGSTHAQHEYRKYDQQSIIDPPSPQMQLRDGFCWGITEMVFSFGDSYTNLIGPKGSVWTWNHFRSKEDVLNAPISLNATTAHGPNWIEYLTGCYQGLPQDCKPALFDVAYGGATCNSTLIPPAFDHIMDFGHQVQQWKTYIQPVVQWAPHTTLTTIWFGINDVLASVSKTTDKNVLGVVFNQVLDAYEKQMELLYTFGMRAFVAINVPPMERSPGNLNNDGLGPLIRSFNDLLLGRIAAFRSSHPEASLVHYFDAYRYFNEYLDGGVKFGFKDITGFCREQQDQKQQECYAPYELGRKPLGETGAFTD
ncbi:hypothetical protein BX666DRAFT_2027258 [Dichotomocladium elegans]|nr:hypothetical protein BX666DRAFT_2027258 [Dichotomocladium elegans]